VREMTRTVEIGLPEISTDRLEEIAEQCEEYITKYLLQKIPEKSIENLFVSCALILDNGQLDVDIQIDVDQSYDTGQSLDDLLEEAGDRGTDWLEKQLMEMKT